MTTTTMNSRAGAMTFVAAGFSDRFIAITGYLAARAERRRVFAELNNLSDRDLEDIGVTRADVPRIAGYTDVSALSVFARR